MAACSWPRGRAAGDHLHARRARTRDGRRAEFYVVHAASVRANASSGGRARSRASGRHAAGSAAMPKQAQHQALATRAGGPSIVRSAPTSGSPTFTSIDRRVRHRAGDHGDHLGSARLARRRPGAATVAHDDATAQQISEANLHRALALPGPKDELRQLADTIDGLLARLEAAFDAQRRFVANASHELRTPLTAARALLEMVLTDPTRDGRDVQDDLPAGARGERAAGAADRRTAGAGPGAARHRPSRADRARAGDRRRHRRTTSSRRCARLELTTVSGSGADLGRPPAASSGWSRTWSRTRSATTHGRRPISRSPSEPRRTRPRCMSPTTDRLSRKARSSGSSAVPTPHPRSHGLRDGLGLGLSIVAAIAKAHEATLAIRAASGGRPRRVVRFPLRSSAPVAEPDPVLAAG